MSGDDTRSAEHEGSAAPPSESHSKTPSSWSKTGEGERYAPTTNGQSLKQLGDPDVNARAQPKWLAPDRLAMDSDDEPVRESEEDQESRRGSSSSRVPASQAALGEQATPLKLSLRQIQELTESPRSLPFRAVTAIEGEIPLLDGELDGSAQHGEERFSNMKRQENGSLPGSSHHTMVEVLPALPSIRAVPGAVTSPRPAKGARSISSPLVQRRHSSSKDNKPRPHLTPIKVERDEMEQLVKPSPRLDSQSSPMPPIIPIPPLSLPTYLQLELSSDRPSALYIHRPAASDFPYESSKVKFDRLVNFLSLPIWLEQTLCFGAMACLDSWLYTFTILPLRFLKALTILLQWGSRNAAKELHDLCTFVYEGSGRVWRRRRNSAISSRRSSLVAQPERSRRLSSTEAAVDAAARSRVGANPPRPANQSRKTSTFRHRRTRSKPSALLPNHKADILQGLLIILSCFVLMQLDASRMYHGIRGQAAIKLYVIYNVLEVFDRLFSALGQDVLECLFSKETLERNPDGRSKVARPLWMFALALAYNVVHATALFYQVITLNVAVNSYSNALLTLLMSNQFVEIKGAVFKKFEKENLFQLTCADVVERFQLWLMLLIIALRNIVEVGGLSVSLNSAFDSGSTAQGAATNLTASKAAGIMPVSFTILPRWTGEVLGPFLIVLGSEMLVDWVKHAYITKFNNVKPNIYGRFRDVLAKDYYTHAFVDQNLTKRLGLPVIPLSCLFIRASMQIYHMFIAMHVPPPIPSTSTSISLDNTTTTASPATTAALQHVDHIFRRALRRSLFGAGGGDSNSLGFSWWCLDDVIALATTSIFFLAAYLLLLALKLVLGMALLSYARGRYKGMKERERESVDAHGRRIGGWGAVEVDEDKRKWIYEDDAEGLKRLRDKEKEKERARAKGEAGGMKLDGVQRYAMAAKRIW